MDCDGLKKNILSDLDGSFLGQIGVVISESEWEWNGDRSRGLGDYRIPKEALADDKGSLKNISDVYKYRGIVRDENLCSYEANWQAWNCNNMKMKMMVIESMDKDTETRRLSPVAIFSDDKKYVDLINGPQDHGWCFGYTCMTRISTFLAVVSHEKNFDVYLTSTPPDKLRFRILNADMNFKVRLSMYYFTSMRIDLYLNGVYINPTNAYSLNGKIALINITNNLTAFMPTYSNSSGANLFYKKQIYFAMAASDVIDLQIAPVLLVSYDVPAITPDQFFEPANLVRNFALLLGIDESKIRSVNIVRSTGSRRRRRDASNEITISLTIYDDPVEFLNDTLKLDSISTQQAQLGATIVNKFATGQLQNEAEILFNGTASLLSMSIRQPSASPNSTAVEIGKINKLIVIQEASSCNAQVPCSVQPILQVVDENVYNFLFYEFFYKIK